jgi:hypothetical protein
VTPDAFGSDLAVSFASKIYFPSLPIAIMQVPEVIL